MIFLQGLNLGQIGSGLTKGLAKGANTFFLGIGALIAIAFIGWMIYRWYSKLVFFKTPCSLTVILDNGTEKTRNDLMGGVFMNNGIRDFKIKIPKTKKPHILGYMPDFAKADADGRIKFITTGDRTIWQQYESKWKLKDKFVKDGKTFEYDLINVPVPRETKQVTVNSIKNWRETIDKKKLTIGAMMIGGFIIMVIAHLVSLFIQTKIKCGIE